MRLRIQTWNPVMKRRTKAVLLICSLAVTTVVASYAMLSVALARAIDPQNYCGTGFSKLSSCTHARRVANDHPIETGFRPAGRHVE